MYLSTRAFVSRLPKMGYLPALPSLLFFVLLCCFKRHALNSYFFYLLVWNHVDDEHPAIWSFAVVTADPNHNYIMWVCMLMLFVFAITQSIDTCFIKYRPSSKLTHLQRWVRKPRYHLTETHLWNQNTQNTNKIYSLPQVWNEILTESQHNWEKLRRAEEFSWRSMEAYGGDLNVYARIALNSPIVRIAYVLPTRTSSHDVNLC